jgi:SAM-dependent methyltransferase
MDKIKTMDKFKLLQKKTQKSFGFQWVNFSEMSCDFKENFLNYINPVPPEFFKGKFGLDAGCGFGRHIYSAVLFGAKMVGMDFSDAINSTRKNTAMLKNLYLVRGDIYSPPFVEKTFDFVYSIGVLHHLPDPEKGFHCLLRYVKKDGSIFIWVYSDHRKLMNCALEIVRAVTTRIPLPLLKLICFLFSMVDYLVISCFRLLSNTVILGKLVNRLNLDRIKVYMSYPFQVVYADWFDRLSAPIRFYYNYDILKTWAERARLKKVIISPTGKYGWRLYGEKE